MSSSSGYKVGFLKKKFRRDTFAGGEVCGKKTIKSRPPTPWGGWQLLRRCKEGDQCGRHPASVVVGIRAAIVAAYALAVRAANLNRCGGDSGQAGPEQCKEGDQCGRPPASVVWVSVRPSWPLMRSPRGLLTSTAAG